MPLIRSKEVEPFSGFMVCACTSVYPSCIGHFFRDNNASAKCSLSLCLADLTHKSYILGWVISVKYRSTLRVTLKPTVQQLVKRSKLIMCFAKQNAPTAKFRARGEKLREDVHSTAALMPPEEDWFFGAELRLEGQVC